MTSQKSVAFVAYVHEMVHKKKDRSFSAKLRRADSEATEYQSWEILAKWVDLERVRDRKAFGLIGSAAARSDSPSDGSLSLGRALYMSFLRDGGSGNPSQSTSASRLRRLLACKDSLELIEIMRPVLRLLESKGLLLCHAQLLDEIIWFDDYRSREKTRAKWANDFYTSKEES